MKRIAQLQPLSKEHHQALVIASRCKNIGATGSEKECADYRQSIDIFLHQELAPHFLLEETALAPVLERTGDLALRDRLLTEHRQFFIIAKNEQISDRQRLKQFGELLAAHVRFEERELFELLQQCMQPEELENLGY